MYCIAYFIRRRLLAQNCMCVCVVVDSL